MIMRNDGKYDVVASSRILPFLSNFAAIFSDSDMADSNRHIDHLFIKGEKLGQCV